MQVASPSFTKTPAAISVSPIDAVDHLLKYLKPFSFQLRSQLQHPAVTAIPNSVNAFVSVLSSSNDLNVGVAVLGNCHISISARIGVLSNIFILPNETKTYLGLSNEMNL